MTDTLTGRTASEARLPTHTRPGRRRKPRAYRIFRVVVLTLTVSIFIAPLVWMLVASF